MIGVVAIEKPAIVVTDDIAEALGIRARQVRVDRLDSVDTEVRPVLQLEYVVITGEVPGLRALRPVHGLALAHRVVVRIGVLYGLRAEQAVAVDVGDSKAHTCPQAR